MAELKNDDLLLVNRNETTYTAPGEAIYGSYLKKPEIENVSLVESNPGVLPRFTDQDFIATVSMAEEGQPLSEKKFDAFVEGTILDDVQFVEPLESSVIIDGTWISADASENNSWNSVTYGDDKFVAVAQDGPNRVMYSDNGIDWTEAAPGSSFSAGWISVTYAKDSNNPDLVDGMFVAVALNGTQQTMYSSDGVGWTLGTAPGANINWASVAYGNGKFVAVGEGSTNVMYSTDGINWIGGSATNNHTWNSVAYGDNKFVAVSTDGSYSRVMYSTNGVDWTDSNVTGFASNSWYEVTYGDGMFVAVSIDGSQQVAYSTNGINWNGADAVENNSWMSITHANGKFVAVAHPGTNPNNQIMYSNNGIDWKIETSPESNYWASIVYGGDKFVAISWSGNDRVMWSTSGGGTDTVLNFADGTDMVALAAGDDVSQGDTWPFSIDGLGSAGNFTQPYNGAFDGNPATITESDRGFSLVYLSMPSGEVTLDSVQSLNVSFFDADNALITQEVIPANDGYTTVVQIDEQVTKIEFYDAAASNVDELRQCRLSGVRWNDIQLIAGKGIGTIGTVGSIKDTTVTLASSSGEWVDGEDVTGPVKTIPVDNAKKYLKFNRNGDVETLLDTPQSPPYLTTDEDPTLTFKFPSTFPSGFTPDEELGDGTTLTVEVTASNTLGSDGPKSATVQPEFVEKAPLAGMTTLYTGDDVDGHHITTGIDTKNLPGMIWIKNREVDQSHTLFDTVRGSDCYISSDSTGHENCAGGANIFKSFDEDGFTVGPNYFCNKIGQKYISYTFRQEPGYFDIVEYDGAMSNRTIPHNLGTVPGMIMVKNKSDALDWAVYIKYKGAGFYFQLNTYQGPIASSTAWASTAPTDTTFTVGANDVTNRATSQNPDHPGIQCKYVAYLFAEDTPDVIKCDQYTGNATGTVPLEVNVGFKPQWVMTKRNESVSSWTIYDSKRGDEIALYAEQSGPEQPRGDSNDGLIFTDNGFIVPDGGPSNQTNYIAIAESALARSMTAEELEAQKLKFLTYDNRKEVVCGEEATAVRAELLATLIEAGYDAADIAQAYSNLDN